MIPLKVSWGYWKDSNTSVIISFNVDILLRFLHQHIMYRSSIDLNKMNHIQLFAKCVQCLNLGNWSLFPTESSSLDSEPVAYLHVAQLGAKAILYFDHFKDTKTKKLNDKVTKKDLKMQENASARV